MGCGYCRCNGTCFLRWAYRGPAIGHAPQLARHLLLHAGPNASMARHHPGDWPHECYIISEKRRDKSSGYDADVEGFADRVEQDIVCCFIAAGADLDEQETCEDIAAAVHDGCRAFVGREQMRGKHGVNVHKSIYV